MVVSVYARALAAAAGSPEVPEPQPSGIQLWHTSVEHGCSTQTPEARCCWVVVEHLVGAYHSMVRHALVMVTTEQCHGQTGSCSVSIGHWRLGGEYE